MNSILDVDPGNAKHSIGAEKCDILDSAGSIFDNKEVVDLNFVGPFLVGGFRF
jgi:hypothetical protein